MKITVKAKASSKKPGVVRVSDGEYTIAVRKPAKEGRANEAIRKALVEHLGVAPSRVALTAGARSKRKVFEL